MEKWKYGNMDNENTCSMKDFCNVNTYGPPP